jgi:hypothetical protein
VRRSGIPGSSGATGPGLHLVLLVDTEHHRTLGRISVAAFGVGFRWSIYGMKDSGFWFSQPKSRSEPG